MRRLLIAAIAAFGLLMLGTVSANADHDGLLYPAGDWQVRQIQTGDPDWSPAEASTVVDATTLALTKPAGDTGTSAETTDLAVEGDTVTVDVALDGAADAAAGAIRLFAYDHPDADTFNDGPTAFIVADGSGTLTLDVSGFAGPIGTLGLVYDASNDSAGTVTFTNLAVDGEPVSFLPHVEPEPEVCEFDDTLTADDEACVEPDDTDDSDTDNESEGTDEDSDPTAVPTSIPAGDALPKTGAANPALLGLGGLALLGVGGGMLALRYRRARGYYRA